MTLPHGVLMRAIEPRDEAALAAIVRQVMAEFGAVGMALAPHDNEIDAMQRAYSRPRSAYLVIEREGRLSGGAGFAPLVGGGDGVCELRKLYLLPALRGLGIGQSLLERCLTGARGRGFAECYAQTQDRMSAAQRLLLGNGFTSLEAPMGLEDPGCTNWYLRRL